VLKQTIIPLPAEGRSKIIQRVRPPAPIAAPVVMEQPVVDPVVAEQRRAYWRSIAPLETKLLSLNAIIYDNGLSFISWAQPNANGEWEPYEAWSSTDFSSLWMAPDFDIGRARYMLFASVMKASAKIAARRPLPGPLLFNKSGKNSPGYVLVKGDANNLKALAPITALHEIYKTQGQQFAVDWALLQARSEADAAWLKANPPPPRDTVIQFWPSLSRRHNTAPAPATLTTPAAR
jgi:hypothetical protein